MLDYLAELDLFLSYDLTLTFLGAGTAGSRPPLPPPAPPRPPVRNAGIYRMHFKLSNLEVPALGRT